MADIELPEWFKVGAELYFRGYEPVYEVVSIDLEGGSWVASQYGDQGRFPLDEVAEHWSPLICPSSPPKPQPTG